MGGSDRGLRESGSKVTGVQHTKGRQGGGVVSGVERG